MILCTNKIIQLPYNNINVTSLWKHFNDVNCQTNSMLEGLSSKEVISKPRGLYFLTCYTSINLWATWISMHWSGNMIFVFSFDSVSWDTKRLIYVKIEKKQKVMWLCTFPINFLFKRYSRKCGVIKVRYSWPVLCKITEPGIFRLIINWRLC